MIACIDEQQVEIMVANQMNTVVIASPLASSKDHTVKLFKTKSKLKEEQHLYHLQLNTRHTS